MATRGEEISTGEHVGIAERRQAVWSVLKLECLARRAQDEHHRARGTRLARGRVAGRPDEHVPAGVAEPHARPESAVRLERAQVVKRLDSGSGGVRLASAGSDGGRPRGTKLLDSL